MNPYIKAAQDHAVERALQVARRPPKKPEGVAHCPDRLLGAGNANAEDHARAALHPETIRLKAQAIAAKERQARQERATGGQVEHALQVARRAAHSDDADSLASTIPHPLRRLAAQKERLPFAGGGDAQAESDGPVDLGAIGSAIGNLFTGDDQRTVAQDSAPATSIGDGVGDFFDRWQKSPLSQFLFATGLGAMASDRVNPLQAIGQGAVNAIPYMQSVREYADDEKQKEADADFIRRLTTQAPVRYQPDAARPEAPEAPAPKTPTVPAAPKITGGEPKPAINAPSVTPDASRPLNHGSTEPKPIRTAENAPAPDATPAPVRPAAQRSPITQIDRQIADLERQRAQASVMAMAAGSVRQRQAASVRLAEIKDEIAGLRSERTRIDAEAAKRMTLLPKSEYSKYGIPADFANPIYIDRNGKITSPLGQPQPNMFVAESGKKLADAYAGYTEAGQTAQQQQGLLDAAEALSGSVDTGVPAVLQKKLNSYGINIGPNADKVAALNAIISRLVPAMRVPGSGTTSDYDAKMFADSLPSLRNTPQANALIFKTMKAYNAFNLERGRIAAAAQTGEISVREAQQRIANLGDPFAGFKEFLSTQKGAAPSQGQRPSNQHIIDELKRRGEM